MRALITGITGFAGGHLAELLLEKGQEVFGVARSPNDQLPPAVGFFAADLRRPEAVTKILKEVQPQAIYHLAGQAFVPRAWEDPWSTLEINIRPQLNILQTMIRQKSSARLLVTASNEVYGYISPERLPVKEDAPMRPDNPYGVSKLAQDKLALQYHLSHRVDVIRARAFNHIGPRQSASFVAASFARQIARIEAGLTEPVIRVGNLKAKRDFTDVTDVTRAYALLMERGQPGEAYNVGTGQAHSIRALLDLLLEQTNVAISIEQDPARMRPADNPVIYADNSKLRAETGWTPAYNFKESLRRVLDYWREEIRKETG